MIEHYNAFISYRHAPLDSAVAARIQKDLERFHIPRAIQKSRCVKRIARIFRDKEELLITSDLNDTIQQALLHSDFLIVICSHATKESTWVQREIEFFLKTHSRKQVLTVVAEGEPSEVIPPILLQQEVEVTLDSGETDIAILPVEPLSCNYRVNSRKVRKQELPRLAAAILGCSYDELKQRQRQYRNRQMALVFSAVAVFLAALTAYYAWSANEIQKNYQQALRNQSQYFSTEALSLLEEGDRISAMLLVLEALPKNAEDDRPVLPVAEFALSQAVNAYIPPDNSDYTVENAFSHGGQIDSFFLNKDMTHLAVLNSSNTVTVWDVQTRQKVFEQVFALDLLQGAFSHDDRLLLLTGSELLCFDYRTGTQLWNLTLDPYRQTYGHGRVFAVSSTENHAVCIAGDFLLVVSTDSGNVLQEIPLPTYSTEGIAEPAQYLPHALCYAPDGKNLVLHLNGSDAPIAYCHLEDGRFVITQESFQKIEGITFTQSGDVVIVGNRKFPKGNYQLGDLYYYEDAWRDVVCLSSDGTVRWEQQLHYSDFCVGIDASICAFENNTVACAAGEMLGIFDAATGDVIQSVTFPSVIIKLTPYEDYLSLVLQNGHLGNYLPGINTAITVPCFIQGLDMAVDTGAFYVSNHTTGNVLRYSYGLHDENWTELTRQGDSEAALSFYSPMTTTLEHQTLVYQNDRFQTPFVLIDGRQRSMRIYTPIQELVENNWQFLGFDAEGKTLLFLGNSDTGYNQAIGAFDLQTEAFDVAWWESEHPIVNIAVLRDDFAVLSRTPEGVEITLRKQTHPVSVYSDNADIYFTNLFAFSPDENTVLLQDNSHRYWTVDLKTGDYFCTTPVDLYDSTALWYEDSSRFAVTDGNCILIYDCTCQEVGRIHCKGMTPNSLFMCDDILFVLYDRNSVYCYNAEDLRFLRQIPVNTGSSSVAQVTWEVPNSNTLALLTGKVLNLIDTDSWVVRTYVPDCLGFCPENELVYADITDTEGIYRIGYYTLYSYEDLIAMAQQQLAGTELSQELRSRYGLSLQEVA